MNIKQFVPKHVNIEQPLEGVKYGEGTYKEICEKVYDGTIYPLTHNDGTIVGLGYESGKVGAEDSIAKMIFERRYSGKPVMDYFMKAFEAKCAGKSLEEALAIYVEPERGPRKTDLVEEDLPKEVTIPYNTLPEEYTLNDVKAYLRKEYGHYLSGYSDDPEIVKVADGVKVTNIEWGRKI